ncbi:hypothetical protein Afil01_53200 [Actinorhabdospora filicis]|uniref:PH domain-containing protein n=1 Tax=Actinorhabdospora filicis TaxID=1785913 RepID=A0A9W6WBX4_9ACTN|nr:hypothetical protein [Actinorhabdospora filicis]GLZ80513.1 hypothetical protein Afil01_53200 [Actinorhabdospora filicis]
MNDLTVTRRNECLAMLLALLVFGGVSVFIPPGRPLAPTVCMVLGIALIIGTDALVAVRFTPDALVADNRWSRVRVPWHEVGEVEADVPYSTRGRARLAVRLRSGGEVPLDVVRVGWRIRSRRLDCAWRVGEEAAARRRRRPGDASVTVERRWGRVVARGAGIGLLVATVVWVVLLSSRAG